MTMSRTREIWVDAVKGLACALVAAGHGFQGLVAAGLMDASMPWTWFNDSIYCFHVQLFFLCSGYLWQRHGRGSGMQGHARAALDKIWLLGVPYVFFTALSWFLKRLCASWVNHGAGDLFHSLFVEPIAPYWYLAALALLFVLVPRMPGRRAWIVLASAATAAKAGGIVLGSPAWCFAARTVAQNAFWFAAGMGLALQATDGLRGRGMLWAGSMCGLVFFAGTAILVHGRISFSDWVRWGLGMLACTAVLAWAARRMRCGFWEWMGRNALPIFLMHTIFASAIRIGLLALGARSPWLHVPAMFAASIAGPLVAMKLLEWIRLDGLLDPRRWRACPEKDAKHDVD